MNHPGTPEPVSRPSGAPPRVMGLEPRVSAHASTLLTRMETLPAGPFRDFHRWALRDADEAIQAQWLKANGWWQLERLAGHLFASLVSEEQHLQVLLTLHRLHAYAVYVSAADVLEDVPETHPLQARTREVIHGFNAAVRATLQGERARGRALMDALEAPCATLPAFSWRLFPPEHLELARRWSSSSRASLEALERESTWMILRLQLDAAERLVALPDHFALAPLVREGVHARYPAVDTLLRAPPTDPEELLETATWSVLVSPSLACYLFALHRARPELSFDADAWRRPLYDAALLVRLLNDYGPLMQLDPRRHWELGYALTQASGGSLGEVLLAGPPGWEGLLTRLRRDLQMGEFNLALHDLSHLPLDEARTPFMRRLATFGRLFREATVRMNQELDALVATTGQHEAATLVRRFVSFHAALYSCSASRGEGDYRVE